MKQATRLFGLLVLLAVLALMPVLPAAAQDTSNPMCTGLSAEDCDLLVSAQDALGGLSSFTIPEWQVDFNVSDGTDTYTMNASGSGALVLPTGAGIEGLVVHLMIDQASVVTPDETQSGSAEVIVANSMAFINYNGEWYGQEVTAEDLGLSGTVVPDTASLAGLGDIDLSGALSTVRAADETVMDQNMAVFQTDIDINQLLITVLSSPAIGAAMGMEGMDQTGMTAEDVQMLGMFLTPMLQGTSVTLTEWVGTDDSLVHQLSLDIALNINLAMFDPEAGAITGNIAFRTQMSNINEGYEVTPPENFRPMDELNSQLEGLGEGLNLGM